MPRAGLRFPVSGAHLSTPPCLQACAAAYNSLLKLIHSQPHRLPVSHCASMPWWLGVCRPCALLTQASPSGAAASLQLHVQAVKSGGKFLETFFKTLPFWAAVWDEHGPAFQGLVRGARGGGTLASRRELQCARHALRPAVPLCLPFTPLPLNRPRPQHPR